MPGTKYAPPYPNCLRQGSAPGRDGRGVFLDAAKYFKNELKYPPAAPALLQTPPLPNASKYFENRHKEAQIAPTCPPNASQMCLHASQRRPK